MGGIGSKPITTNQTDYFGKGLQVLFPKSNFSMQMKYWMKYFVTFSLKNLIFSNASHVFLLIMIE
jgi:hypothetical protein